MRWIKRSFLYYIIGTVRKLHDIGLISLYTPIPQIIQRAVAVPYTIFIALMGLYTSYRATYFSQRRGSMDYGDHLEYVSGR